MTDAEHQTHEQRLERARRVFEHATRVAGEDGHGPVGPEAGAGEGRQGRDSARPRRRGGRGRAPAQEPPITGAAAVDAEPDVEEVARTVALNQLNHSARSRGQLAEAMARKDVPAHVADRVLDRFEEVGLIDDAEYAAMLVRTRQSERGLARRALAVELKRKGIEGEAAAQALDAVDPDEEEAAARRVVEKRLRSMTNLEPEVKKRRLAAMLARKGHPAGISYRVIDEAMRAENAEE
ncbi:regulatory protein RecX [Pseudactinotalea sp.]|uniref:regulatory protein RecX n=1 Tax=Pseudactinotalea sp. TaxID=1926260 RepID=UPI003B3B281D